MTEIAQWLAQLGLAEYAQVFEENEIELDVLDSLEDVDLRELGVSAMGHRKRILKAAAALAEDSAAPSPGSTHSPLGDVKPEQKADGPATENSPLLAGPERRHLTVMFCDLVGSVALGEALELEDYRDLLGKFRDSVVGAIETRRGFVARHQGDGILAYFGYPRASENDPERAVHAGLDIVQAVGQLGKFKTIIPTVRVGIATGDAVVGDVLATGASPNSEFAAFGTTPNLAARLQGEAAPDTVVISEATYSMVAGAFEATAFAPRQLKGISEPVPLFRVDRAFTERSRFDARTDAELTPLVGRQEELQVLFRRWEDVVAGEGRIVTLVGPAGIGKSRLLREFRLGVGDQPYDWLGLQCSPDRENSPFHPLKVGLSKPPTNIISKSTDENEMDWARHLSEVPLLKSSDREVLLDFFSPHEARENSLSGSESPARRRERLLGALVSYLTGRAEALPLVCQLEDVHWADASTREFVSRLVSSLPEHRVFAVLTTRPGFEADWFDQPSAQIVMLSRLAHRDGKRLAQAVSAATGEPWSDSLETILERGEGNPLYIEELTRAFREMTAESVNAVSVPASLRDSLMARLDALPVGKPVALAASAIGRTFDGDVLHAIWTHDESTLRAGLEELKQAALIGEEGDQEMVRYTFRHNLIHETAYESLLRETRAELHERIATVLASSESNLRVEQPEVLARHYRLAGRSEAAVNYGLDAVKLALSRSAMVEALAHCMEVEIDLEKFDAPPEPLKLAALLLKGPILMNLHGSGSAEVASSYREGLTLASRIGKAEEIFTARWGLWLHQQIVGAFEDAQETADAIIQLGKDISDSTYLLQAHHSAWTTAGHVGDHIKTLSHTRAGLGLYRASQHSESMHVYGDHDAGVCGHVHDAHTHWCLGNLEQAVKSRDDSLELARNLNHPPSLLLAETHAAMLSQFLAERERVRESAERVIALSIEHEVMSWHSNGEILLGWVEAIEGNLSGFERMAQGVATRESAGSRLRQTYFLAIYAEQLISAGRLDAAKVALEGGIQCLELARERRWEPLLRIVQGDLAHALTDPPTAVQCYETAIGVAKHQQALSFELVARCRLSSLWADGQNAADGLASLQSTYEKFTEGLHFAPLRAAEALLDKASPQPL